MNNKFVKLVEDVIDNMNVPSLESILNQSENNEETKAEKTLDLSWDKLTDLKNALEKQKFEFDEDGDFIKEINDDHYITVTINKDTEEISVYSTKYSGRSHSVTGSEFGIDDDPSEILSFINELERL